MLVRKRNRTNLRGFGAFTPTVPAELIGTIFDPNFSNKVTDLSTQYYEAVRTGQPDLAQKTLSEWNATRQAAGVTPIVPVVSVEDARSIQASNQQHEVYMSKGLLANQPLANQSVQSGGGTVTQPTAPASTTPQQVSQPSQTTTTTNKESAPSSPTVPTVTSHMLETGEDYISKFLSLLDPRNYISTIANSTADTWWIPGIPNWVTVAAGLGVVGLWMFKGSGDGMGVSSMTLRRARR